MLFRLLITATLGIYSLSLTAQHTQSLTDQVDRIFQDFDNPKNPGAALAIVKDSKVLFKKGYGSANLEYNVSITPATPFHVASVSKQFTAFSILLLEEQGKLKLSDDIRKYIPELPDFGHKITLYHLLSHTSGLRDQWNLFLLQGVRPDDVITTAHVLNLMAKQQELNFPPGEEYLYCNSGYTLLAETVARTSGVSFANFIQKQIFSPLGMKNSQFVDDHELIIPGRAQSYFSPEGKHYKKRLLNYANPGATNLVTTVEDLSNWVLNFKSQKVGKPPLFKQFQRLASLNSGKTFGGALGLFVGEHKGHKLVEHGGADAGFRAQISMFPEIDLATIVLSNSANTDAKDLTLQLAELFLDLKEIAPSEKKVGKREFIALSRKQLKAFEGNYVNKNRGFTRHIYLKGDSLMHFRTENNESALAPISATSFKVTNVPPDVVVSFKQQQGELIMTETVNGGTPRPLIKFDPKPYKKSDWEQLAGIYWSPELETSYTISYLDGKLKAVHNRMGTINLEKVKYDFFLGDRGFFRQLDFVRNEQNEVIGMRITNGRVRNLWFEKR